MPDSRVAALLRDAGVPTDLSIRAAARRCNVSPQTISNLMRGETRRLRKPILDKIADGLAINRDLLERASLADAGYIQATGGSSLAEALELVRGLSPRDRATVLVELAKMQQTVTDAQEMRNSAGAAE